MKNIETFMDFLYPFSYIGFSILNRIEKKKTTLNKTALSVGLDPK